MSISGTSMEVIASAATAALAAQVFKCMIFSVIRKPVNFRTLVQTGGMPSSHSALMAAMTTSVGLIEGFSSTIFAVALGITVVVMYDAAGLRQAAGRMAGILNKLTEELYSHHPEHVPERLRELLGHTPFEVIVGAILGMGVSYIYHVRLLGA